MLVRRLSFTMILIATTNHSDNKTRLTVFSNSSGSAVRLTVKSLVVWNLIMKLNFKNKRDLPKVEVYFVFYNQLDSRR